MIAILVDEHELTLRRHACNYYALSRLGKRAFWRRELRMCHLAMVRTCALELDCPRRSRVPMPNPDVLFDKKDSISRILREV